jgi:hypothetical protein
MTMESRKTAREHEREARAAERLRQKQAEARKRLLTIIGALAAVAIVFVAALVYAMKDDDTAPVTDTGQVLPAPVTGEPTVEKPVGTVANASDITGVVAYDTRGYPAPGTADEGTLPHNHVDGPVTYSVTPPVGGDHNLYWMTCGIYTAPVPSERAVHNLEHGAIWITYRPSLAAADVQALTDFVLAKKPPPGAKGDNRYLDLTPWKDEALPSPIVVSAWGYQLKVDKPDDPRIAQFVEAFRFKQGVSPELASCDGPRSDLSGNPAVS